MDELSTRLQSSASLALPEGCTSGSDNAPLTTLSWPGLPQLVSRLRARLRAPPADVPMFHSEAVGGLPFSYLAFPKEVEYTLEEIFVRASYLPDGVKIPDDGVVFDVGANQGIFSVFASGLAERVRVYAFEPVPDIHAVLTANRVLYNVQGHAFNAGLSHTPGRAQFTYYPGLSVLSGMYADKEKDRETSLAYDRFANPEVRLANASSSALCPPPTPATPVPPVPPVPQTPAFPHVL